MRCFNAITSSIPPAHGNSTQNYNCLTSSRVRNKASSELGVDAKIAPGDTGEHVKVEPGDPEALNEKRDG